MTLPLEYARTVARSMQGGAIQNLIAQTKAKQVLNEVRELPENFPQFTADLDERATFIAYASLAAGCSMIESQDLDAGYAELQSAADLLESAHRTAAPTDPVSGFHCLIGAMAFYACGQYSRAFVLIKSIETFTPIAGVIAAFLRKDSTALISRLNTVLLADNPDIADAGEFDQWALTVTLARVISLVFEHTLSGEDDVLARASAVLRDASIISENGGNPTFWWLARLLRLMLDDYGKGCLWNTLPPFFGPDVVTEISEYIRLLALSKPPVIELWRSQLSSLELALDSTNSGGVINLRTSAGKTRVAELAMLKTLKADPTAKVLYLAPFRSLAFEMERTFAKFLSPLGYSISHLYGGSRFSGVDRQMVNEAHVTIATPEKAKAMLRAAPELFESMKLVIIDEGHLLGANKRNVRNEMFLEYLRRLAQQQTARILLLSAVLPNASDLASWIGGKPSAIAKSDWKPSAERFGLLRWTQRAVAIEWQGEHRCFNPHFVEFVEVPKGKKDKTRPFPGTKAEAVAATAVRLAELGPVLIFAGQAQWVPSMAKNVLLALGSNPTPHPWPETEWKIFQSVCTEELGADSLELRAAKVGVICHCNDLPPQVRIAVEKMISKCPPRIIVATTTLGQGVNIGISSVIISTPLIGKNLKISTRDFWNICGRAGRAFVDSEGKVIFAIDATQPARKIASAEMEAKRYFDLGHLDSVQSGLLQLLRYVKQLATNAGVSFDLLLELIANDQFDRLGTEGKKAAAVFDWIDDQLLAFHVGYKGAGDASDAADWVDDAFRESLAAIQERQKLAEGQASQLMLFLKARANGVLKSVPTPEARRAIVASGLPLSVGIAAFEQLDAFRAMADGYLADNSSEAALNTLVAQFEGWARDNAIAVTGEMPENPLLETIRPKWLAGAPLHEIVEIAGKGTQDVCADFYGYSLPWLFHSVSQKFDKATESNRIDALAKAGLLVELGLPGEAASKVFMAGVRSRVAAIELSAFVLDPAASISRIRSSLLNPSTVEALEPLLSAATLEWLQLLSIEHGLADSNPPRCLPFRGVNPPSDVDSLHLRQVDGNAIYLCSTDGRFKARVQPSDGLPFDKVANDHRFIFVREGSVWHQRSRDPRIPA